MNDDLLQELTAIDEQILELIDKRARTWNEIEENGYEVSGSDNDQLINNWLEVAADYELDEDLIIKSVKIINMLCRKVED